MAKRSGGIVFRFLNFVFTVVMFALPTVLLAYWYFYIREPQVATEVTVIQQAPSSNDSTPARAVDPVLGDRPGRVGMFGDSDTQPIRSSNQSSRAPSEYASSQEQTPIPHERDEHELRKWIDASGEFSVIAKFYSANGDTVTLIKEDESKVTVPIQKLDDAAKRYLRNLFKSKGITASF